MSVRDKNNYFGGKGSPGVIQTIINEIPPHRCLIEGFGGKGTLTRTILKSDCNVYIELSKKVFDYYKPYLPASVKSHNMDFFDFLSRWSDYYDGSDCWSPDGFCGTVFYLDPPYLKESRRDQKDVYDCELSSEDHSRLLELINNVPCAVLISHYPCDFYNNALRHWRRVDYKTTTRQGVVTESLYCNFDKVSKLHDYSFLGNNNTDRQRIRRKIDRHVKTLSALPVLERNALINSLSNL